MADTPDIGDLYRLSERLDMHAPADGDIVGWAHDELVRLHRLLPLKDAPLEHLAHKNGRREGLKEAYAVLRDSWLDDYGDGYDAVRAIERIIKGLIEGEPLPEHRIDKHMRVVAERDEYKARYTALLKGMRDIVQEADDGDGQV